MKRQLVLVHGRSQEHQDPMGIKAEWIGAWKQGLAKSGLDLPIGEEEIRFLTQVQRYSAHLSDSDRRLLLAMVRKFAQTTLS